MGRELKETMSMAVIRLLAAFAAIGTAFAAPASAQDDAAARAFAAKAVEKLRVAMPDASFEMNAEEPLQIDVAGAPNLQEGHINLHRVYAYCETVPEPECETEFARLVDIFVQEPPEKGPDNLRIIVRDAEYWGYVKEAIPADKLPQHRKVGEDLFAILALDSPQSISLADPDTIEEFGLTDEDAWRRASAQTRLMLPAFPTAASFETGLHAFEGTEYIASMLFDVEAWQIIAAGTGPDLMITAASDQFVLAGIVPDGETLDRIREAVVSDCASAPRCVSPNVYRFRDGMWVIAD